jgi:hypothetical protein
LRRGGRVGGWAGGRVDVRMGWAAPEREGGGEGGS